MTKLQRHTLNLRAGDFQRLSEALAQSELTAGEVIRRAVSRIVDRLERTYTDADLKEILDENPLG